MLDAKLGDSWGFVDTTLRVDEWMGGWCKKVCGMIWLNERVPRMGKRKRESEKVKRKGGVSNEIEASQFAEF